MLLNVNKAKRLKAIIINNSQNKEPDHIEDSAIGAYRIKQKTDKSEISKAIKVNPRNLPKKQAERGIGRESINSKPLSLNSRTILVITNKLIVKTQNRRNENASIATCV